MAFAAAGLTHNADHLSAGALVGWRMAGAIPAQRLRSALAAVLIATGAHLIVRNA
jgi:hypothetical protein